MANVIKLRKGLGINLKGKPAPEILRVDEPEVYALMPADFTGIMPKVTVHEGDAVKAGEPLFVDKNHPEVNFVSPVSGTVLGVDRGERRRVLSIRVQADSRQEYVEFERPDVSRMKADDAKAWLMRTGLFAFFRQRPYDITASPDNHPKAIFVSAFDSKPLAPDFEFVLKGQEADFQSGLDVLACLAPVHLGVSVRQQSPALRNAKNVRVHVFDGPHPAGNVGIQIHHVDPINKGEQVWTLGAEDVIFIGRTLRTGHVDLTRTIVLAGSEVTTPAYVRMKVGAQLSTLLKGRVVLGDRVVRVIDGNVLTGHPTTADGFLGAHSTQVTVIPEGSDVDEFFGWISPRLNDFSTSRAYFSWLFGRKREYTLDARVKGGERHMIMSGEYDRVLPMDILPEFLIKAILAGDIERMEALGIYEVAPEDFALCEFVDSSKLELQRIVREGLDLLRQEIEGE